MRKSFLPTTILLVSAFFIMILSSIVLDTRYMLNNGYDFATGEYVQAKYKNKKLIWVKRSEGRSKLFKEYGLSHPEPLLGFSSGTGYKFEFFKIETYNRGWQFWRFDYYIMEDRPADCWDGIGRESMFFRILREFKPPPEEIRAIYKECIRQRQAGVDVRDSVAYLQKEYDRYKRSAKPTP